MSSESGGVSSTEPRVLSLLIWNCDVLLYFYTFRLFMQNTVKLIEAEYFNIIIQVD